MVAREDLEEAAKRFCEDWGLDNQSVRDDLVLLLDETARRGAPDLHRASQELLTMLWLYPGHPVHSRGPIGCIHRALEEIDPVAQKKLADGIDPEDLVEKDEA